MGDRWPIDPVLRLGIINRNPPKLPAHAWEMQLEARVFY